MANNTEDVELRRIPDWQWLEELLGEYNITEKRTGLSPKRDFTGIEARLYREIQNRYRQREKPDYIKTPTARHTSKQHEDSVRIHGEQVETMKKMGYGLMLDGFTFYKIGHELEPYDFEQNFQMHQAYEIHKFIQQEANRQKAELLDRLIAQQWSFGEEDDALAVPTRYLIAERKQLNKG